MRSLMTDEIHHLHKDHFKIALLLQILEHEIRKSKNGQGPDYEFIILIMEYFKLFPDKIHHRKEDLVYSKMRVRIPETCKELVDLELEHRNLEELTRKLISSVESVGSDQERLQEIDGKTANEFVRSYREHMRKEEEHFFPLAQRFLLPADWADLRVTLKDAERLLFDKDEEAKANQLYQQILDRDQSVELASAS